jgi:hypothetical protein
MDRKIIAAPQVSLDGLIEGPEAEVDWIDDWDDPFEVLPEVDTASSAAACTPDTSSTGGRSSPTQPASSP